MANTPIESGIGNIWFAKQAALGTIATPNAASTIKPRWASGALKANKQLGSETYIDGNRFDSPATYVDNVAGEVGSVVVQAQPETAGVFCAWILGVDTVTGGSDPYTHTITSAGTTGPNLTIRQKVGVAVGPVQQSYWDAKIAKLTLECGQDQKTMHLTPEIQSLKAAEIFGTAPVAVEATTDPFYWTEINGQITLDAVGTSECHGETLEIDTKMTPYKGDNINPFALIEGKGDISRSVKTILTDDTLANYYQALYGQTTSPASGGSVAATVYYAAIVTKYVKSATRTLQITTPKVAVKPDDMQVAPLPEGGIIELIIGGMCLKSGATAALTVVALTGDSGAYAP